MRKLLAKLVAAALAVTLIVNPISYVSAQESNPELVFEEEKEESVELSEESVNEYVAETQDDSKEIAGEELEESKEEAIEEPKEEPIEEIVELKENSWRYNNGAPIYDKSRAGTSPNAWEKVNGQFVNDKGEIIEGAVKKGIDVSHHQGEINWEKVKADGIDYAIIRCGYSIDKPAYDDRYWERNVKECERLGIPYGVYLYSYAENVEDAVEEAKHVLRLLKIANPTYPVYYDLEDKTVAQLSDKELGELAKTFGDMISQQGYDVGIYASYSWWNNKLTSKEFDHQMWSKWIARWNSYCGYEEPYDMWQCTAEGSVDGIKGNVDIDFWMKNEEIVDPVEMGIQYSTHIQDIGWQRFKKNGEMSGTTGNAKSVEAVKINLFGLKYLGSIEYSAHVSNIGWLDFCKDGAVGGTEGQARKMEAIKIQLTGEVADYFDVYYRTHVANIGWLDWAKNGENAGSAGFAYGIEALEIKLVEKGEAAPGKTGDAFREYKNGIQYRAHVSDIGWQGWKENGTIAGTTASQKQMEALAIQLKKPQYNGEIVYDLHVQDIGWINGIKNGEIGGTTGKAKQLEAVRVYLTGEMEKHFDVYYRVHIMNYGWLDWTKNGGNAGSEGIAHRMEAIEIKLVEKGAKAPGSTNKPFVKR